MNYKQKLQSIKTVEELFDFREQLHSDSYIEDYDDKKASEFILNEIVAPIFKQNAA